MDHKIKFLLLIDTLPNPLLIVNQTLKGLKWSVSMVDKASFII